MISEIINGEIKLTSKNEIRAVALSAKDARDRAILQKKCIDMKELNRLVEKVFDGITYAISVGEVETKVGFSTTDYSSAIDELVKIFKSLGYKIKIRYTGRSWSAHLKW